MVPGVRRKAATSRRTPYRTRHLSVFCTHPAAETDSRFQLHPITCSPIHVVDYDADLWMASPLGQSWTACEGRTEVASTGARDMTDIVMQYGLFLAKAITVVVLAWIIIAMVVSTSHRRGRPPERLEVKSLNEKYEEMSDILKEAMFSKKQFKRMLKERKARRQAEEKKKQAGEAQPRKRIFVLDFRGDMKATAVSSLREEVTTVLTMVM